MLEAGAQCFPLYLYSKVENKIDEKNDVQSSFLFENNKNNSALKDTKIEDGYKKTDAITDEALKYFQDFYRNSPSPPRGAYTPTFYYNTHKAYGL
jgi:hypothetical protein